MSLKRNRGSGRCVVNFFLTEIEPELWKPHKEYLENIKYNYEPPFEWRELVFLETAYMTLKNGDIIKLVSGINNSGKTWTTLPQVEYANWLLRNYWITAPGVPEDKRSFLKILKPYSLEENVEFYPDPEKLRQKIANGSYFNCLSINEGMKAAINIRSWDPEVIDMILELFTERAQNNYLIFEYQLTRRPPKMLLSRFNEWQHKMSQKWMVVSMPSSVYRTEDPLWTKEIEKIKSDTKVSHWFTHKNENPNYIGKFVAPKITLTEEKEFKRMRDAAKAEYEKGRIVKKQLGSVWYAKIEEFWQEVNKGQMAYIKIPEILAEKHGFNNDQIKKFMKDFDRFDREFKLMHPQKEIEAGND